MKSEFRSYLEQVGLRRPLLERCEAIVDFYRTFAGLEPETLFVSEHVQSDGNRQYESLWLVGGDVLLAEAKRFPSEDNFDLSNIKGRVTRWEVAKTDYDLCQTHATSRLSVEYEIGFAGSGSLRASGDNCAALAEVLKRYIIPNLK